MSAVDSGSISGSAPTPSVVHAENAIVTEAIQHIDELLSFISLSFILAGHLAEMLAILTWCDSQQPLVSLKHRTTL
jgi:threonine aldolase